MSGVGIIISLCFLLPVCSFAGATYILDDEPSQTELKKLQTNKDDINSMQPDPHVIIKQLPYNPHSFDEKEIKSYAIENQDGGFWF